MLTDIHIDSLHSFLWKFAEHDNITNNSVRNFEQLQFLIRRSLYGQIAAFCHSDLTFEIKYHSQWVSFQQNIKVLPEFLWPCLAGHGLSVGEPSVQLAVHAVPAT